MPTPSSPSRQAPSAQAEAARYALLRRLAPSMRHHLVVNLQPIGMIYEVMDRRLRAPVPDLAHVQDSAGKINGFAKAALHSCIDVVSWLAPDDSAATTLPEAVRECTSLLATSLSFRGYALRSEAGEVPGRVGRSGARALLSASLLYWTDHARAPAELAVTTAAGDDAAVVVVEVRPAEGTAAIPGEANYRALEWPDVEALAAADGVRVHLEGERIELRLPWVPAQTASAA